MCCAIVARHIFFVHSKGLPQYFLSGGMEDDAVCLFRQKDMKLLLYDDFLCRDKGCLIGTVCKKTIAPVPKSD